MRPLAQRALPAAVTADALAAALAVALFLLAGWLRLRGLLASPYPCGVDGYWYLMQARAWIEQGRFAYPSAPLVPWSMAQLARVVDPVLAMKLVAAFGSAALVLPAFLVARRVAGPGPALLGAALTATSAESSFLATEFVKQAVGLPLAVGFLVALDACLAQPKRARAAVAIVLLAACAATHKTAVGLALLLGLGPLAPWFWQRRSHARVRVGAIVLAGAVVAGVVLAWPRGLAHLLSAHADLGFAVLATPGRAPLVLGHEVAWVAGLAAAALLVLWLRRPRSATAGLVLGFVVLGLAQALPWLSVADDQGLGYRLRLCGCICLAPCAALVAAEVSRRWSPALRAALLGAALAAVLSVRSWQAHEGVVTAHPAMVEATARLAGKVPAGTLVVVPERHTAFMAAYYGRLDVRLRPPPALDPARTLRLLPGAAIRPGLWAALDELRARPRPDIAPTVALHAMHPNGLVLLSEATFQHLLARLPEAEQQWYRRWVVQ
jgi:hypothetical protein